MASIFDSPSGVRYPDLVSTPHQNWGAGMYPSIMGAPLDMYGAMGGVGAQQQAQNQAAIQADMARYQYPEQAKRARVGEYIQNITGLGGAGGFSGLTSLVTPPKTE